MQLNSRANVGGEESEYIQHKIINVVKHIHIYI